MIWIPYIIFQNTDDDEAVKVDAQTEDGTMRTKVSVKRENNFTRSGPEIADEVIFKLSHIFIQEYLILRLRSSKEEKISSLWVKPTARSSTAPTSSTTIHLTLRSAKWTCRWRSLSRAMLSCCLTTWSYWLTQNWHNITYSHGHWTTMIQVCVVIIC